MTFKTFAALAAAFALGAASTSLIGAPARAAPAKDTYRWLNILGSAVDTIDRQYIKPVDPSVLVRAALEGMVGSLDAHSSYISSDEWDRMTGAKQPLAAVGLNLTRNGGALIVLEVFADQPGAKAGLRPGDRLIAIDGRIVAELSPAGALALLRGAVGSPVALTVDRGGESLVLNVTRELVRAAPMLSSRMIGDVGYLELTAMNPGATAKVAAAVRDLRAQNPALKGLVLDLRESPGGQFAEVIGLASNFIESGEIVRLVGRGPKDIDRYMASGGDVSHGLPLVVLVGAGTGSGAEVLAGALQERGRARLVGLPTFGMGTVQTVIPLSGGQGGALKMTTGYLYLPSGRPIQKLGVQPDLVVAQGPASADQVGAPPFREASLAAALEAPGAQPEPPPVKPDRPPPGFDARSGDYQLTRALALLHAAS